MRVLKSNLLYLLVVVMVAGSFLMINISDANASSNFSMKGMTYPTSIEEGSSFSLSGVVTCSFSVEYARVGLLDSKGEWMKEYYADTRSPSKTINIKTFDSKIKFGNLKAGTYYYAVRIRDSKKNRETILKKKFVVKAPSLINGDELSLPDSIYVGNSFNIKGDVISKYTMKKLVVGIANSKKSYISKKYKSVNPKSKKYDISKLSKYVRYGELEPGTYYNKIVGIDTKGNRVIVALDKFTVSEMKINGVTTPELVKEGHGFYVKGKISSKFVIDQVVVGVLDSKGNWAQDVMASSKPNNASYDLNKMDSLIKFGKLDPGNYKYLIVAKDKCGIEMTLLEQDFKVIEESSSSSVTSDTKVEYIKTAANGVKLYYNQTNFLNIGKQPFSGPCGLYSMAYGRLVIDGSFGKNGYTSYYNRLSTEYGFGSDCAYWDEANAGTVYTTTSKGANILALNELVSGKPCILALTSGYTGNQHFVTAIGYVAGTTSSNVTTQSFIVLDPAYGKESKMSDYPLYKTQNRIIKFYN